ncbi:MAG: CRISPR-associated endonuclease Cas2 [Bacteroidales bacterium]|nr:CRISPR-associated endonuclease Cas2 [Bacteroidales bacterium]
MAVKKTPEKSFIEAMLRLKRAGLTNVPATDTMHGPVDELAPLDERIGSVFRIFRQSQKPGHMISFVMYDIENNKIRTNIAKFLIRKGCIRVQKSIFLANFERKKWDEIHRTLKEVQEMYKNYDSIFIVPVSTDEIRAMKIIGQSLDMDMIIGNRSTLFF